MRWSQRLGRSPPAASPGWDPCRRPPDRARVQGWTIGAHGARAWARCIYIMLSFATFSPRLPPPPSPHTSTFLGACRHAPVPCSAIARVLALSATANMLVTAPCCRRLCNSMRSSPTLCMEPHMGLHARILRVRTRDRMMIRQGAGTRGLAQAECVQVPNARMEIDRFVRA